MTQAAVQPAALGVSQGDVVIERVGFELRSERMIRPAPDLVEITGDSGRIKGADHRLDRADRGRRHRQCPEAEPYQRHRLDRVARHLAAHAEWYPGITGPLDDLAEES